MGTPLVDELNARIARVESLLTQHHRATMCELKISLRCTNDNSEEWNGKVCCPHCLEVIVPEAAEARR